MGIGLNFRLLKLNANFRHLSKNELVDAYRQSKRRLIFLDYEGTILSCDNEDGNKEVAPDQRLIKLLTALSDDCKNLVFLVSGRQRKLLDEWFKSVKNLSIASEHGFFYRYGMHHCVNEDWRELFPIKDWTWKDSVMKILEGFTEKTEGSYILEKETMITWYYKDCDIYFGHIQANEISTHLQNIFENSKLDIVHGNGYIEIKPRNVNKGYFISSIIKNEFEEGMNPDFILALGDDTSDEEMFKYLNSVHNQLTFFNDCIKIFSSTIGRKPSSANYFLNEVPEVLEYLESLIHSNSKDSARKRLQSTKLISDISLNGIRHTFKSESLGSLLLSNNNNI
jgi:trehalose 6-phosphate synthase/phosphatase